MQGLSNNQVFNNSEFSDLCAKLKKPEENSQMIVEINNNLHVRGGSVTVPLSQLFQDKAFQFPELGKLGLKTLKKLKSYYEYSNAKSSTAVGDLNNGIKKIKAIQKNHKKKEMEKIPTNMDLLDDVENADLKLICQNGEIQAHGLMLSRSPYFKTLLSRKKNDESKKDLTFDFKYYSKEVVCLLRDYFYGKNEIIDVSLENLMDLYCLADLTNVDSLKEKVCVKLSSFLCENVPNYEKAMTHFYSKIKSYLESATESPLEPFPFEVVYSEILANHILKIYKISKDTYNQIFPIILQAADAGHTSSQSIRSAHGGIEFPINYLLGILKSRTIEEIDYNKENDSLALYQLGLILQKHSKKLIEEAANKNFIPALKELYTESLKEPNNPKTIAFLEKGVSAKDPYLINQLALRYGTGNGVNKDQKKAFELFQLAAKYEFPSANHNIGYFYLTGDGIAQDLDKAYEYLLKAYNKGVPEAKFHLAMLYMNPLFSKKNTPLGIQLLKELVSEGFKMSKDLLQVLGIQVDNP